MPFARRCDPGPEGVFSNPGMARRKFDNPRLAPGGLMIRDVYSPGGRERPRAAAAGRRRRRPQAQAAAAGGRRRRMCES